MCIFFCLKEIYLLMDPMIIIVGVGVINHSFRIHLVSVVVKGSHYEVWANL